jgi:hypothetical protein
MPQIITCPDCGRKLRVPDELVGKKVKCPDCKVKFTGGITTKPNGQPAKTAPARAKDDDEQRVATAPGGKKAGRVKEDDKDDRPSSRSRDDERPGRKRKARRRDEEEDEDHPYRTSEEEDDEDRSRTGSTPQQRRKGWKMTLLGLNLIIYGIYTLIGTWAVGLLGCATLFLIGIGGMSTLDPDIMTGSAMGATVGVMILYGALGLGYFAAFALQTTGHGFCMAIPDKPGTGRKPLAIATFSCMCAIIALVLLTCGAMFMFRGRGHFIGLLPMAIFIGFFVCYFLFLRAVAVAMREPELARQIVIYMITIPVLIVVLPLLSCLMAMIGGFAMLGVAANSNSPQGTAGSVGGMFLLVMICNLVIVCIEIGMFIWYVVIVHKVRNAVRDYVD